jgi:hypothetical protein
MQTDACHGSAVHSPTCSKTFCCSRCPFAIWLILLTLFGCVFFGVKVSVKIPRALLFPTFIDWSIFRIICSRKGHVLNVHQMAKGIVPCVASCVFIQIKLPGGTLFLPNTKHFALLVLRLAGKSQLWEEKLKSSGVSGMRNSSLGLLLGTSQWLRSAFVVGNIKVASLERVCWHAKGRLPRKVRTMKRAVQRPAENSPYRYPIPLTRSMARKIHHGRTWCRQLFRRRHQMQIDASHGRIVLSASKTVCHSRCPFTFGSFHSLFWVCASFEVPVHLKIPRAFVFPPSVN